MNFPSISIDFIFHPSTHSIYLEIYHTVDLTIHPSLCCIASAKTQEPQFNQAGFLSKHLPNYFNNA